jgi:hypothetical protein
VDQLIRRDARGPEEVQEVRRQEVAKSKALAGIHVLARAFRVDGAEAGRGYPDLEIGGSAFGADCSRLM